MMRRVLVHNCTQAMLNRAKRATGPKWRFLHRGEFWNVRLVSEPDRTIWLYQ